MECLWKWTKLVGGWTNPSEKYSSKWESFPNKGEKNSNIWNHHLARHDMNDSSIKFHQKLTSFTSGRAIKNTLNVSGIWGWESLTFSHHHLRCLLGVLATIICPNISMKHQHSAASHTRCGEKQCISTHWLMDMSMEHFWTEKQLLILWVDGPQIRRSPPGM